VPIRDFFTGPKRNVLAADELVRAVRVPVFDGPQQFAKVGTRNAMVIAVCSFAFVLRPVIGVVGSCIGSAGPTPLRALEADQFLMTVLNDGDLWHAPDPLDPAVIDHFGELAGAEARPIDDVRGTAAYRRHAVSLLARRTLSWTWAQHLEARQRGEVA
jgi:CO/xanthine dehydrogenase FAD-binding subunit